MKNSFFLTFILTTLTMTSFTQDISYKVSVENPQTRYATVQIEVQNYKKSEIRFKMPVWTPGSYMVREFSRNVEGFSAHDKEGYILPSHKENKHTWVVKNGKKGSFVITYRVYSNEVSVRTTFIDNEAAFLSGTSLFMYAQGLENLPGKIEVIPPGEWKSLATGLNEVAGKPNRFTFSNYDELADCPIQLGNFDTLQFDVLGVPHYVALVGHSNVNKENLKKDLQKVCVASANVVGKTEFTKYWFFVHHVDNGGGGLEHHNSTAVVMPRWNYSDKAKYDGFLRLCAHEYFHAWNIKRIRPIELGPFDYDKEVYTKQLWVAEGITSYYDRLLLVRAGITGKESFLQDLAGRISYSENTPGAKIHSLAEASMDAWIKFYRPDENSINSSVSYYTKGALVAALLDLEIIRNTNSTKNMDNLLRLLYDEYYLKKKRGFTEQEFIAAAEKIAGTTLKKFFDDLVYGTVSPDYEAYFTSFGVEFKTEKNEEPFLGALVNYKEEKTTVRNVLRNSPAFNTGLTANDVILSVNGIKPTDNFTQFLKNFDRNAPLTLIVQRGEQVLEFKITLAENPYLKYSLKPLKEMTTEQEKLYKVWLGE